MRRLLLASLLALLVGPAIAEPVDVGPAVGAKIPALAVRDSHGAPMTLSSMAGKHGATVVFFRSARWCPFCQKQLIGLKEVAPKLAEAGYPIVAISHDAPEALAAFSEKQGLNYGLYSDEGSKMIDAFKLRDPQYPPGNFAYGVPRPSIFVVDRSGVVKAKLAEANYRDRPSNELVLSAVSKLN